MRRPITRSACLLLAASALLVEAPSDPFAPHRAHAQPADDGTEPTTTPFMSQEYHLGFEVPRDDWSVREEPWEAGMRFYVEAEGWDPDVTRLTLIVGELPETTDSEGLCQSRLELFQARRELSDIALEPHEIDGREGHRLNMTMTRPDAVLGFDEWCAVHEDWSYIFHYHAPTEQYSANIADVERMVATLRLPQPFAVDEERAVEEMARLWAQEVEIVDVLLRIDAEPEAYRIRSTSNLTLRNSGPSAIETLVLSIDPNLEIASASVGGQSAAFVRHYSVVDVPLPEPVEAGGEMLVTVQSVLTKGPYFPDSSAFATTAIATDFVYVNGHLFPSPLPVLNEEMSVNFTRHPLTLEMSVPDGFEPIVPALLVADEMAEGQRVVRYETGGYSMFAPTFILGRFSRYDTEVAGESVTVFHRWEEVAPERLEALALLGAESVGFYTAHFGETPHDRIQMLFGMPLQFIKGLYYVPMYGENPEFREGAFDTLIGELTTVEELITHEVAHSWWANYVAATGPGQIWLIEGMANFSSALALGEIRGEESMNASFCRYLDNYLSQMPEVADANLRTGLDHDRYEFIVYMRGAIVLEMLHQQLGDEAFFAGMRSVTESFAGRNLTVEELQGLLETASGQSLQAFFDSWVDGTDMPRYEIRDPIFVGAAGSYRVSFGLANTGTGEAPVEVEILAEGNAIERTAVSVPPGEVVSVVVETAGIPLQITVNPRCRSLAYPTEPFLFDVPL